MKYENTESHPSAISAHSSSFSLSHLSATELIETMRTLVQEERRVTLLVLDHLAEIEHRGLHLARGYGSLHEFAVEALGYSSAAAQRRIQSMRAMRDVPEIRPQIESGELNLSQVAMIQTIARSEKLPVEEKRVLLTKSITQTTRETEVMLHEQFPENRKLTDRRTVVSAERTELRITLSKESIERLENLKHRLAHQIRTQIDSEAIELILKIAEAAVLKKSGVHLNKTVDTMITPTRSGPVISSDTEEESHRNHYSQYNSKNPRTISRSIRSAILSRAHGQCEYIDPMTRKKCTSPFALQVDHVHAVSRGGTAAPRNLQVLCARHNQWKGAC